VEDIVIQHAKMGPFLALILTSLIPSAASQIAVPATAFSVTAYGATGQGKVDDSAAVQKAIDAAIAAGGGTVYFPAGTYRLDNTLHNDRSDLVSLAGSGMGSRLIINSKLGISLASTDQYSGNDGFHGGQIHDLYIKCNDPSSTAIQMTDLIAGPHLSELSISKCNIAFQLINQRRWNERLMAENISDDYNNHLFHFSQNPTNPANSYGYAIFNGIYINKAPGQDVFYLTGGAYIYHSTFIVKGNLINAKGASIFHIDGKSTEPCSGMAFNVYDIAVEGDAYFVVKSIPNGCRQGPTGNALVGGRGTILAAGAAALATPGSLATIADPQQAAYLAVPVYTATAASSDTASSPNITPSSKCFVQPNDQIAANAISQTFVSRTGWQSVTVSHPTKAKGGRFQIWCTP
jgi:hypothetical protein